MERTPYLRYKNVDVQTACCAAALDALLFALLSSYGETEDGGIKGLVSDVFYLEDNYELSFEKQVKKRLSGYLNDDPWFEERKMKASLLPEVEKISVKLELLEENPWGLNRSFEFLCKDEKLDPEVVKDISEQMDIIFRIEPQKIYRVIPSGQAINLLMKIYEMDEFYEAILVEYDGYGALLFSGVVR